MNIKLLVFAVYLLTESFLVVSALRSSMKPIHSTLVVKRGHSASLVCMGQNIEDWDSFLFWKFNGTVIEGGKNRKVIEKYLPDRKVNFTLLISNVSEKDVGTYTCKAFIGNYDNTEVSRGDIKLKLHREATWPKGSYALPLARSGCPGSVGFSWSLGSRSQDTEDTKPLNTASHPMHLKVEIKEDAIGQRFCVKESDEGVQEWPKGDYCIYKKNACPAGFTEGGIKWDDEDTKNDNSVSGVLPDGSYHMDTIIYFCCRSDGSADSPISLPTNKPFVLIQHSNRCQKVKGMRETEEWIFWDCEDDDNGNQRFGTYPAAFVTKDIKLFFCYYHKE